MLSGTSIVTNWSVWKRIEAESHVRTDTPGVKSRAS